MDGMTGMEAAEELRKFDTDCMLIFTTTSTDHALEGFRVRALHYLVKPFTESDIDALTDELIDRVPQSDKYMLLKAEAVKYTFSIRILYMPSILHIEYMSIQQQAKHLLR